jgi:hypothetical protein
MFYLLALPYRLSGSTSIGLWIGAALINALAIVAIALIAKRHGGTSLMIVTLIGCTVLMRALGADFLRNPWNPYLPVFAFGALIFLVWAMACGDAWALPVAAAVATFCAQTHIAFLPLALPLWLIGTAWLIWIATRGESRNGIRRPSRRSIVQAAIATVAVLFVMWLPPLLEQVTHSPGNISKVIKYLRHPPPGPRHTMLEGLRVVFGQFWVLPEWVKGPARANPFSGEPPLIDRSPVPVLVLGFVLATVVLWRRRRVDTNGDERGWRLAVIIAVTLGLGVVSVARTTGAAYDYRTRWTLLVAMLATAVSVWAGWLIVAPYASLDIRRIAIFSSVVVIGAIGGIDTVAAARAGTPQRPLSAQIDRLGEATLKALPPGDGDVIVESPDAIAVAMSGLQLWLERHGVHALVEPTLGLAVGDHRTYDGTEDVRGVVTVASDSNADQYSLRPDQRLIAATNSFDVAYRQRVYAQINAVAEQFAQHKLTQQQYIERERALSLKLGHVTAVFLTRPDS